uniref:Uncharacterized protein n=1 Tax=Glossina austeni TaxID=7395 RepID=A0A1A9UJK1_GLOAU
MEYMDERYHRIRLSDTLNELRSLLKVTKVLWAVRGNLFRFQLTAIDALLLVAKNGESSKFKPPFKPVSCSILLLASVQYIDDNDHHDDGDVSASSKFIKIGSAFVQTLNTLNEIPNGQKMSSGP